MAVAIAEDDEPSGLSDATYTIDYVSGLSQREMIPVPGGDFFQREPLDAGSGVYIDSVNHTLSAFDTGTYDVTYDLWYTVRGGATARLSHSRTGRSSSSRPPEGVLGESFFYLRVGDQLDDVSLT